MVVICLGPICLPLWPVIALTVKPVWDRFVPESVKGKLENSWNKVRSYLCPARKKPEAKVPPAGAVTGDDGILRISSEDEYKALIGGATPVVVKFTADFCGPCKMIAPRVSELAIKLGKKVKFCEVDIEAFEDIALNAGVSSIPAFHLLVKGKKLDQVIGTNVPRLEELCQNAASMGSKPSSDSKKTL